MHTTLQRYAPLSPGAIAYAWDELARRAGVQVESPSRNSLASLGLTPRYARPDAGGRDEKDVFVIPCSNTAWEDLLTRSPQSLDWMPIDHCVPQNVEHPLPDLIPILFWGQNEGKNTRRFAEISRDGHLIFHVDIISAAIFMLSRWEEMAKTTRDQQGRFPGVASTAYRQGFLDRPVVDEYALIIRAWLQALLPGWQPVPRNFSVRLSHDIDTIVPGSTIYRVIRRFGGDLLKRRSLAQAGQTLIDTFWQIAAPENTSRYRGIHTLANLSQRHHMDSAFYFMTLDHHSPEYNYDIDSPLVQACIKTLQSQGMEIGLHPGHRTLDAPRQLAREKARLDAVLGKEKYGGRQHSLLFQVPDTWRHWELVGLTYDSTLGYADREGFRCGTCYPYQPFDLESDRVLTLWEIPLIVMDITLHKYRKLTPGEAKRSILELARRCKVVGGVFTLLWHNTSLHGMWRGWRDMYQQTIEALAEMEKKSAKQDSTERGLLRYV